MKKPYQEVFNRNPDFRVKYKIYSADEGGRHTLPFPGIRWDFKYEHPKHRPNSAFMIYPEFEDEEGNPILETVLQVPKSGTATMWILSDELHNYHKEKIKTGTIGWFVEGAVKVGECEVIELINLK